MAKRGRGEARSIALADKDSNVVGFAFLRHPRLRYAPLFNGIVQVFQKLLYHSGRGAIDAMSLDGYDPRPNRHISQNQALRALAVQFQDIAFGQFRRGND
jgi:hypothetical protein